MFSLLILSALISLTSSQPWEKSDFNLLLILPNNTNDVGVQPPKQSWQNSQELLTGTARLCVTMINQSCMPYTLSVTKIWTDCSSAELSLVQLIHELTAPSNKMTIAVVGWFCNTILSDMIGIASNERLGLIQMALNTFLPVPSEKSLNLDSQYYQMLPSAVAYVEALAQFMTHVGWARIAIVFSHTQTSYHFQISEQVTRGALYDKGFGPIVTVEILDEDPHNIMNAIRLVESSGVKMVYTLLPTTETILLLCLAYDYGLRWPEYGWIVPDVSLEDVLSLKDVGNCSQKAVQGIISLQVTNTSLFKAAAEKDCSEEYTSTELFNIYTNVLHDSIWAIALAMNETFPEVQEYLEERSNHSHTQYSNLITQKRLSQMIGHKLANITFSGRLGDISLNAEHKTETNISLCQVIDGGYQKLGLYNPRENTTYFKNFPPSQIPRDNIAKVYVLLPLPVSAILMTVLALCIFVTLLNTMLYFYYRNEPEIKASSVELSIIVFFSCYALYIGSGMQTIKSSTYNSKNGICLAIIWTIFPFGDLILSTLLVKICRIHHVFNRLGKIKKCCSDQSLLILILVIVLGKVLLLLAWTALDKLQLRDYETYYPESKPPFYKVEQKCYSDYHGIWVITNLMYTAVIGCVLAFVAFKTRKIRHKDFKDTKKINAYIVTTFMSIAILTSLWAALRTTDDVNLSKVLLSILYLVLPVYCQVYLFLPKTMPPLKKTLCKCLHLRGNQEKFQFLQTTDQLLPFSVNTKITLI